MNIKKGIPFLIYSAVAVLTGAVIRFLQYLNVIDFNTGFFLPGHEAEGLLIYTVLGIIGAGFIALTVIGKKKGWTATTVSSDGMSGGSTMISGVAYIIGAVISVWSALSSDAEGAALICAWLFALSLGIIGFCLIKNSVPPSFTGFINLFPALFFFMQATKLFTTDLTVKNRSDSLLLLFIYVLATLYFSSMARFFARLETRLSRIRELIIGGFSFILSAVYILSKIMYIISGNSDIIMHISPEAITLMIISGGFLIMTCTAKETKQIEYLTNKED